MKKFSTNLRTIAAAAILAFGASTASAGETFTVDPSLLGLYTGGPTGGFQADLMSGFSSARIVKTAGAGFQYTGTGYIVYTSFSNDEKPVSAFTSGVNGAYGLYATFQQTFTCSGALSVGTTCSIDTINLNLFADAGNDNAYDNAAIGVNPTVGANGSQILLGTVDKIIAGQAGISALGGAFQNVNTNFNLTADGSRFFVAPVPFYNFAFSSFNNTSLGLSCNTAGCAGVTDLAINSETGGTDFNGQVPEPTSVALFGIALAGIASARRRKSK